MAREIKVTIKEDGTMIHEVDGVAGSECFDFTRPLTDLTGTARQRLLKTDYWQTEEKNTQQNMEY
jgi:hypothetical protein